MPGYGIQASRPRRPQRRISRSTGIQPAKQPKDLGMTDTNYLRDSLKDAAQGPLDSCTLCGAINRSYEEAHNHFHQPSSKPPTSPWQATPPAPLFRPARSAASSSTAPTSTPTPRSTRPTTSSSRPLARRSRDLQTLWHPHQPVLPRRAQPRSRVVAEGQRVGGDHPLPVGDGVLQVLLERSGPGARGTDIGHTLAQEASQAFTEAGVNVDGY
jgi:hypothetical protein